MIVRGRFGLSAAEVFVGGLQFRIQPDRALKTVRMNRLPVAGKPTLAAYSYGLLTLKRFGPQIER